MTSWCRPRSTRSATGGASRWQTRALPADDATVHFCIAGWVFGHSHSWMPTDWKVAVGAAVDELERVSRSGGTAVIVETLGTEYQTPHPSEELAAYDQWLEEERGFRRQTIRTDYQFDSVANAARVTGVGSRTRE